ncbi:hypothetical protein [Rhodococcus pyridinivorans]|uniref:hypothetical protein n=1 Tax=Rhodococcus pyridinivorans TaxID=103816 RepID=UPI003AABE1F5
MTIDVAEYSLYVSHVLGLILAPVLILGMVRYSKYVSMGLWLIALAVVIVLPTSLLFGPSGRFNYVPQLTSNVILFLLAVILFSSLTRSQFCALVRVSIWALVLASILQIVFFPSASGSKERVAGITRPVIFFLESTWLAIVAAMLFAAALTLGLKWHALLISTLIFVVFTRSALAIAVAVILVCIPLVWRSRGLTVAIIAMIWTFAVWFVYSAFTATSRVKAVSSLDTRQLDIFAVKAANGGAIPWTGSRQLVVYDSFRDRMIPNTSNVLAFDLYWKFGIAGLVLLAFWAWLWCWYLPRISGASITIPSTLPAWVCLALLPAVMQLNNGFGRPWMWVMSALLVVAIAKQAAGSRNRCRGACRTRAAQRLGRQVPDERSGPF